MKILFIGGPVDGTRRNVDPEMLCVRVSDQVRTWKDFRRTGPTPQTATITYSTYRREKLRGPSGDYFVYLLDSLPCPIQALIDGYSKQGI